MAKRRPVKREGTAAPSEPPEQPEFDETGRRIVRLSLEELADALLPILRQGLPVTPETAGEHLPYFPLVLAHAKGTDHLARVIGLDVVVTAIVKEWPDTAGGAALRVLFALSPTQRGWSLARRQAEAAELTRYSQDHFRKHVQRRLLLDVAYEFARRNSRYKPYPVKPMLVGERPPNEPPAPGDDLLQLELEARAHAEMFALRADLLAVRRPGEEAPATAGRFALDCLWHYARVLDLIATHVNTYGATLRLGASDTAVERAVRVLDTEWPFAPEERAWLGVALATHPGREEFAAFVEEDRQGRIVLGKWREWAR